MRSRSLFNAKAIPKRRKRLSLWKPLLLGLAIVAAVHLMQIWLQQPQAILVLGGAPEREVFAAKFARSHPNLPIWVSSGSPSDYTDWVFSEAGIEPDRLHLDHRAVDTVTNFTTLVDTFKAREINSLYLITSDYHIRRAKVIGEIVLGSRGINFKPIAVPSDRPPETVDKAIRDGARAMLWVVTGRTGSEIGQLFGNRRLY